MEIINDLRDQIISYYDSLIELLPKLGIALVVCFLFLFVTRVIRKKFIKYFRKRAEDQLLISFFNNVLRISNGIIAILIFMYIVGLGKIAGSILGAAGVSAFIIGFAFKDIGENFLAGVFMAFKRPFRLGDTIKTGDVEGVIVEMSLRDTHIKTFDGKDVYVPNGQIIKTPLFNYTIDGFLRGSFIIGVESGTDIEKARKIILNCVKDTPGVLLDDKPPRTHIKQVTSSSIDIEIHYWVNTFDKSHSGLEIKTIAQKKILEELENANIGSPYDVIEIKNTSEK